MAYKRRTVIAGDVIEVYKFFDAAFGKRRCRGKNKGVSKQSVLDASEREAERKLRWKMNANFGDGDLHLTLTYGGEVPTPEEAKRELRNFMRRLKGAYYRLGLEFKWMAVTEWRGHRIHHHLVMNGGPSLLDIQRKWKAGRVRCSVLNTEGQYADLAAYLIKETSKHFRDEDQPFRKRWTCSRNLKEPVIKTEVIDAREWRKEPVPKKGYFIEKDRTEDGVSDRGMPFQFYSMRRIC